MRAIVKARPEPGLWMESVDIPVIGHNDVLIRIRYTAVCGTDLHIRDWDAWAQRTIPIGMVVGHEYVGEIVEVGSEVEGLTPGQRVSGEGHVTCGHCRNCRAGRRHFCRNASGVGVDRPGAFAEYLSLPAGNVFPIPDDVPDDIATILDPFGNATHTALTFPLVGEDVLITGAGPIGLMACAIARHVGARHIVVTDLNPHRLEVASAMGASRAIDPRSVGLDDLMSELGMTEGFDVGMEMSGAPGALTGMLHAMNHGSNVALLGIPPTEAPIDWNDIIFKGLTIKGIYGRLMFETWYKMTTMLQTGLDLRPVITGHFPAEDFDRAFDQLASGDALKVILDWSR
ncbi:MAG: L-threonine 3-dehydrogenase [Acidimicrobiia bacterium]|nr:L-threonine 3-dehydrogenase [Acidimicrobiia bacterium]